MHFYSFQTAGDAFVPAFWFGEYLLVYNLQLESINLFKYAYSSIEIDGQTWELHKLLYIHNIRWL